MESFDVESVLCTCIVQKNIRMNMAMANGKLLGKNELWASELMMVIVNKKKKKRRE